MCGFGENSRRNCTTVAHGSWNNQIDDPNPNRHTLWGALVGGPAPADDFDYEDVRSDYIANEVACDYNAGFVAARATCRRPMAAMHAGFGIPALRGSIRRDVRGGLDHRGLGTDQDPHAQQPKCMAGRRSDRLSYRIYLDLSEVRVAGYSVQDVVVDSGFLDGGSISGLQIANASSDSTSSRSPTTGNSSVPGRAPTTDVNARSRSVWPAAFPEARGIRRTTPPSPVSSSTVRAREDRDDLGLRRRDPGLWRGRHPRSTTTASTTFRRSPMVPRIWTATVDRMSAMPIAMAMESRMPTRSPMGGGL